MLFIASAVTGCAYLPFYGSQVEDDKSAREHAFVLMIRIMCIWSPPPNHAISGLNLFYVPVPSSK